MLRIANPDTELAPENLGLWPDAAECQVGSSVDSILSTRLIQDVYRQKLLFMIFPMVLSQLPHSIALGPLPWHQCCATQRSDELCTFCHSDARFSVTACQSSAMLAAFSLVGRWGRFVGRMASAYIAADRVYCHMALLLGL